MKAGCHTGARGWPQPALTSGRGPDLKGLVSSCKTSHRHRGAQTLGWAGCTWRSVNGSSVTSHDVSRDKTLSKSETAELCPSDPPTRGCVRSRANFGARAQRPHSAGGVRGGSAPRPRGSEPRREALRARRGAAGTRGGVLRAALSCRGRRGREDAAFARVACSRRAARATPRRAAPCDASCEGAGCSQGPGGGRSWSERAPGPLTVPPTPFVEEPRKGAGSERPGCGASAPQGGGRGRAAVRGQPGPRHPERVSPPRASFLIDRIWKSTRNTWDLFGDLTARIAKKDKCPSWWRRAALGGAAARAAGANDGVRFGLGTEALGRPRRGGPEGRGAARGPGPAGPACAVPFTCVPRGVRSVDTEMGCPGRGRGASAQCGQSVSLGPAQGPGPMVVTAAQLCA